MNRFIACMSALGILALIAAVSFGEATPEKAREARSLIGQFTSAEFAVRQAAVEKLIAIGPDVTPLVRKTLAETTDAEVKLRCQMVLKGIADKYGPAGGGRPNLDASKITIDATNTPLEEVLRDLADQSGNALVNIPGPLTEKTVTL
jgi:hypothetical protein